MGRLIQPGEPGSNPPRASRAAVARGPAEHTFKFNFDNNLLPWHVGCNSQCGAACSALGRGREKNGNFYASLAAICGSVVWIEAILKAHETDLDISFDARCITNCEGCIPLVYVGRRLPRYPAYFTAGAQPFTPHWQTHSFSVSVPQAHTMPGPEPADTLVVAIGFASFDTERAEVGVGQQVGIDSVLIVPR